MKCGEIWRRHVALTQHVSNLVANQLKAVSEASETGWRLEARRKKQRKRDKSKTWLVVLGADRGCYEATRLDTSCGLAQDGCSQTDAYG